MHGVVADFLGDPTARYAGRLTLNPLKHIDLFGSIILPLLTKLSVGFAFGYAKPVPYNPYNLRPGRFSESFVAGAGPFTNLVLALVGGAIIRAGIFPGAVDVLFIFIFVNVLLGLFNLIPIPPLDGSKVFEAILPAGLGVAYGRLRRQLESNPFMGMLIVVLIVYLLGSIWGTFIYSIAQAIAGV
jgi:Zn-dependent protease